MNSIIKKDCEDIIFEYEYFLKKLIGKKILITGGCGFLLSYLSYILVYFNKINKKKITIHIVDKFFDKSSEKFKFLKKDKNLKFINKDISLIKKFNYKYEYIIHGASIASPVFYKKKPIETINSNIFGLKNILESQYKNKKLKSLIFMSSSEIYGDPDKKNIPTKENYNGNVSCTGPRACYDESKRLGETISTIYQREFNVPIKIVRPFNVYGPGQKLDDGRIIPDIMKSITNNNDITLYSNGKPTRSFCYISDQIRGIIEVMFNGINGQAYNVGNNQEVSINQLAKIAINLSKKKLKIIKKVNKDKTFNVDCPNRRCPNIEKIYKLNQWKPKFSLKDGLLKTINYYKGIKN